MRLHTYWVRKLR